MGVTGNKRRQHFASIETVNLKYDFPTVQEALSRLDHEIAIARQQGIAVLKIVHGYGSTGAGGDIRTAVQARLHHMVESGQIRACVFGENWAKSDEATWSLLQERAELKHDSDLGRANLGITVVVLREL
jgi:hypothetical protein